jgi:hypothetical protein
MSVRIVSRHPQPLTVEDVTAEGPLSAFDGGWLRRTALPPYGVQVAAPVP